MKNKIISPCLVIEVNLNLIYIFSTLLSQETADIKGS